MNNRLLIIQTAQVVQLYPFHMNRVAVGEHPETGGQVHVRDLHLLQAVQRLDGRVQFAVRLVPAELVLDVDRFVLNGHF